jgi:diguanylate cyclase (GGDEF)-like protein
MRFSSISFRGQILIGCIFALVATNTPLIVVEVARNREIQKENLQETANHLAGTMGRTLALPLWDFNYHFLEELVNGLATDDFVEGAVLEASTGERLAEFSREAKRPETWADTEISEPIVYLNGTESVELGTLTIQFSGLPAAAASKDFMMSRIASLILQCLLTSFSLYIVLGAVLNPLRTLIDSIRKIENGELDQEVRDIDRADEIGRVALALDQLRKGEKVIAAARTKKDTQTTRERRRMLLALKSTDDGVIVVDEHDNIVLQNDRSSEFFGRLERGASIELIPSLSGLRHSDPLVGYAVKIVERDGIKRAIRIRQDTIRDEAGADLGQVFLASDVSEQLRQQERADYLANHDGLTKLPNRRSLETAQKEIGDGPCGLLLCDLDRFKQVNDSLGHAVGDAVLQEFAAILRNLISDDMMPIRLGGDEFAVFSTHDECKSRLEAVGGGLQDALSAPVLIDGRPVDFGVSLGLACIPDDAKTADELMQIADAALYEAKKEGRSRLVVADPEMRKVASRRKMIETTLTESLSGSGGPVPVFQMQTDSQTNEIVGFEALARWTLPNGEAVSPNEFIPIAEETGLVAPLTAKILNLSCGVAKTLRENGFSGRVSVNASPTLFDGTLSALVASALAETGCDPSALEIEITEQVILAERSDTLAEIEALRWSGISVALDDFGMGYSSLSYLRRYPVDKIKIDRSFVSELSQSNATQKIVRAIVELARALDLGVVAEGAETEQERDLLRSSGVDTIQGWVDGKPLPIEKVLETALAHMQRAQQNFRKTAG